MFVTQFEENCLFIKFLELTIVKLPIKLRKFFETYISMFKFEVFLVNSNFESFVQ